MDLNHRFLGLVLLIFSLLASTNKGFSFQGNRIHDLQGEGNDFIGQTASWTVRSEQQFVTGQIYSTCDKTYLLGGPAISNIDPGFIKNYKNLPPHNMIYFSVHVTLIDDWKLDSSFAIMADNQYKNFLVIVFGVSSSIHFLENKCGAPDIKDLEKVKVYGRIKHSGSSLNLKISKASVTEKPFGYLGFRDLILVFQNETKTQQINQICGLSSVPLKSQCVCPEGQHNAIDGSCQICHNLCKTCFGSLSSQCFECQDDAFFDGNQCTLCHPSCKTCSGESLNHCSSCFSGYYLFEDGTCMRNCDPPLIQTTTDSIQRCFFPCASHEFLYPNGECKVTCDFTYNSIQWGEKSFCRPYCQEGYYLPSSGSTIEGKCITSCPIGFYIDEIARYCIPCKDTLCSSCPAQHGAKCQQCKEGAILDSDGTCRELIECSSMNVKYVKALSTGHQFILEIFPSTCDLDIATVQRDLSGSPQQPSSNLPAFSFDVVSKTGTQHVIDLVLEGSILEESAITLILEHLKGTIIVPKKIVPSKEVQATLEYVSSAHTILTSTLTVSFAAAIALGSTAALWSIVSFSQFIGYFIYLNIEFPFQVKMLFSIFEFSTWSFLPNPFSPLTQPLLEAMSSLEETQELPQKFIEEGLSPYFVQNGGSTFMINFLAFLLLIIVMFLRKLQKWKKSKVLKALKRSLMWNTIIRTYLESAIPLMLATLLQLRYFSVANTYLVISSILAIASLLYLVGFFTFLTRILRRSSINHLKSEPGPQIYGTLWGGIKLQESPSKYYHILILLRGILLIVLIVFFQAIPIFQIVSLIFYNTVLVLYLFKEVTFDDRYLNIINQVKEILILIGEVFVLGLAFQSTSEEFCNNLGWLIIACFLSTFALETSYMMGKQIVNIKKIVHKLKVIWNKAHNWFKNKDIKKKKKRILTDKSESELMMVETEAKSKAINSSS